MEKQEHPIWTGQERETSTTFEVSNKFEMCAGAALHVLHTWEIDVTGLFS